jgi:ubiquinone/menaquinone biosynthesis C-methylase UbiE
MEDNNIDYISINKQSWNGRVDAHIKSEFYGVEDFIKGKTSLQEIELNLLGDIKNKSILHLQCHFGQDTISLSRMGAKATGIDLSDKAIESAKELNATTKTDASFICCNVYDLPQHLNEEFDIVYTSYGTIGWLPDMDKWANVVSTFLKPGGKFIFVEFHPVVWMFDDYFKEIGYNYFNTGAIVETENGTYADRNAALKSEYVMWNHGMAEVINSLIKHNLEINLLEEFDYSPYNCFKETTEFAPGKFRIKHLDNKIPMVYSIVATKK